VSYLRSCAKNVTNQEIGFEQITSTAASHQAIKLGDRWYLVWDNMLVETFSSIVYGFGNY
jgi:hypothetical protein